MTSLYALRVLALAPERREARLRVFVLVYDDGYHDPLPDDPSFFLRALHDNAEGHPLGDAVTLDQILDEDWVDAETWRFVESAEVRASRNDPLTPRAWAELPRPFPRHQGEGCFADEDRMVHGDVDVRVTDARWLAHLNLGTCWETASYPTEALPRPDGAPPVVAEDPGPSPAVPSLIDPAAMLAMADVADPLTDAELTALLEAHRRWLTSGGGEPDGEFEHFFSVPRHWQVLAAAGYAVAVFKGPAGSEGEQLHLRFRHLGEGRDLRGLDLSWADLTGVAGENVDLRNARLRGATATDAHLPGVNLSGADLLAADLSRANLRNADLTGADLRHTDLEEADLSGADFTGARIGGILLAKAKLDEIHGFGTMPFGWNQPIHDPGRKHRPGK